MLSGKLTDHGKIVVPTSGSLERVVTGELRLIVNPFSFYLHNHSINALPGDNRIVVIVAMHFDHALKRRPARAGRTATCGLRC